MAAPKYYYNAKTLRYERARLSIKNIALTSIGVLLTGALFFVGLMFLQNRLVTTPNEKELRSENKALKEHLGILATRISGSKIKLATLIEKEENMTKTFFDVREAKEHKHASTDLLLQDDEAFNEEVRKMGHQFGRMIYRASKTNMFFASEASLSRQDLATIMSFPGLIPIENADPELLVSGYGTRINPWHKGRFHHDGIDFAGERGEKVLSAGSGTVSLVKRSELTAGFGNYIEVDHGHGYVTRYAHLGEIKVRQGQRVTKGLVLATIGMSGGSIAPHLHYEVMKDGHNVDPMRVLVEGIDSDQFHLMADAANHPNQTLD